MLIDKTLIIGINIMDSGSTGIIMRNALEYAKEHGDYDYLIITKNASDKPNSYSFGVKHNIFKKIVSHYIYKSYQKPEGLIYHSYSKAICKKINSISKQYKKTIVHLHNLHHSDIDITYLFKYLSIKRFPIIYTLHDCWSFTGGCYYYNYVSCNAWQTGCKCNCVQNFGNKYYPVSKIYELKKKCLESVKDIITFVPVSSWLKGEMKNSFLKEYKTVINPGECSIVPLKKADIKLKEELGLENKKVLLSIASCWYEWKGPKYIYQVADLLPKDYVFLVIGSGFITKNYKNIIHIENVGNEMLPHYYSIADCFVSTTQDDNLPLVLMEAQICGVPIVGFGHGGTPEEIIEGKTGYMVGKDNNVKKMVEKIIYVCEKYPFKKEDIINNGSRYKKYESAKRYLKLYNSL